MFRQGLHEPQGPDDFDSYQSASLKIYRGLFDVSVEVWQHGSVVKKYTGAEEVFVSPRLPHQTHVAPITYWGVRNELRNVADIDPVGSFKMYYLLGTLHIHPL